MAAKRVYKNWVQLEKDFKAQGLKHVKLIDSENNDLVSFNTAMNKSKTALADKLKEIHKKLNVAEDGIYIVLGQHRFGKNVSPVRFYYSKNYSGSLEEIQTVPQNNNNGSTSNLLSVDLAMANVKDAATYKASNLFLEQRNKDLREDLNEAKQTIKELEAKIEDLQQTINEQETMEEGKENKGFLYGLGETLKEIMPVMAPIGDRLLDIYERKQRLEETVFLHENGYEIKGLTKKTNGSKAGSAKGKVKEIPQPGAEGWDEFIDYMSRLPDSEFDSAMEKLKDYPEILAAAEKALFEETEEEEEEEEA